MALGTLPPWLDVRPEQFVRAASEGAQAGLAVARLNREADEAAQRSGQQGREFEEAQALRKWEQQQAMQMHAEQMREKQKEQQQQLSALTAYRQSMNEARTQAEKDRMASYKANQSRFAADLAERSRHNLATEGKISGIKGTPIWHPADATTGAPGYFESATGTVHLAPKAAANPDPRIKMIQNELAMHERAIASGNDAISAGVNAGNTHTDFADALRNDLLDLQRQSGRTSIPPGYNGSPATRPNATMPAGFDPNNPISASTIPPVTPAVLPPGPAMPTFPALPPRDKREKGQTYAIPGQAPHTWTGTGWVPYAAPSHDESPPADASDETIPPIDEEEDVLD